METTVTTVDGSRPKSTRRDDVWVSGAPSPFQVALNDCREGVARKKLWYRLGWMEVKRRYRRTVLGPFWATVHIAVYILCVGFIFSSVFDTERAGYLQYLTTGFIAWMFVYNLLQDSGGAFTGPSSLLQEVRLPYSMFVYMVIWRNLIVNAHNYSLYVLLCIFYPISLTWYMLLVVPGYLLVLLNVGWICAFLALAAARYRDVQQLIASIIQVMIFVTPIFWSPEMMSETKRLFILTPNLLYHLTNVIRAPLLGEAPMTISYVILIIAPMVGYPLTFWLFGKCRSQIIFWIK